MTDENYPKTILRNLIANAVKALESVEGAIVSVEAEEGKITVADNGPGMDPEQFERLGEHGISSGKSGLGMYLIRDMAVAIGCSVLGESEVGKGTRVGLVFG